MKDMKDIFYWEDIYDIDLKSVRNWKQDIFKDIRQGKARKKSMARSLPGSHCYRGKHIMMVLEIIQYQYNASDHVR